jgi:histidinol-phosphate aminotransferase
MRDCLNEANRYPDTEDTLREKLASLHKVKMEQVVLGCGTSEILGMAAEAFLAPGKKVVLAEPTFPLVSLYAKARGAAVASVRLNEYQAHDLEAMLAASDSSTGLVYICNPNNPTGTLTSRAALERFLTKLPASIPVIIDEAYHHYAIDGSAAYASFIDRSVDDARLIVVRTFSKIFGLAGQRIGYAIASKEFSRRLAANRLQFGENLLGIKGAMAALDDTEHIRVCAKRNKDDRQEFRNVAMIHSLGHLGSETNFVLLKADRSADEIIEHFRRNNILLGPLIPSMERFVRVTLGRPNEMREFWRVWDLLPHNPHHHMTT